MLSALLGIMFFTYADVGFKRGNQIEVQPIYGLAHVTCRDYNGFRRPRTVSCSADLVSPALRDRFVIDENVDADTVDLKSTFASGRIISRSSKFDADKRESSSLFNIWIHTLTQTPIVGPGKNVIDYTLSKKREVVKSGTFEAYVDVKEEVRCRPRSLSFSYDCHEDSRICDDYFYFNNNCQN